MHSSLRHFLPFGLVRSSQLAAELRRLGLPTARARALAFRPATAVRLKQLNFDLLPDGALAGNPRIVDIGANTGDWTADALALCGSVAVECVEPDPRLGPALQRRFASDPTVRIHTCAIGASRGRAEFKLMQASVLNSFRTPADAMAQLYPEPFQVRETVTVDVRTLDELLPDSAPIAVLKIDTQGFEREVLSGATAVLQRTACVLLEVNFERHYDGEADFFELTTVMRRHGFALANYSRPKGGQREALYADAVYVPSGRARPEANDQQTS